MKCRETERKQNTERGKKQDEERKTINEREIYKREIKRENFESGGCSEVKFKLN